MALLAIPIIFIGRHAQPASFIGPAVPFAKRPLIALDAIAFYLWKIIWPAKLGVDYGRTPQIIIAHAGLAWLIPLILFAIVIWKRNLKFLLPALAIFLIALAPILGIIPFDFQAYSTVADHYVYLAMLGPAIAIACFLKSRKTFWPWIILFLLPILSIRQARTWRDAITISQQALIANPNSWASHEHLASAYIELGDPQNALPQAQLATQLNPKFGKAFDTLGQSYSMLQQFDSADQAFGHAIDIAPSDVAAHLGWAGALADAGKRVQAIKQYEIALRIEPKNVIALSNLASVYAEMGQFQLAIDLYNRALRIDPNFPAAMIGRQHAIEQMTK